MRTLATITFAAAMLGLTLLAEDIRKPAQTVQDFGFMTGEWRTDAWGGNGDEIWSKPESGNMVGVWRFMKAGKLVFTEHISLEDDAERGPVMRLKHFHPGMKGWEEKDEAVTLYLEKFQPGDARWNYEKDGKRVTLRYRALPAGVLECTLTKNGEETTFQMKKATP
jgi:hypothetical protein